MNHNYIDLRIGAPRRLSILRRNFEQWFVKNPHAPRDRVQSWRDVRFATLTSHTGLDQGLNDGKPIWYTHDGEQFRNERDADDIINLRHTGWYTDEDCGSTAIGIVASLPHGRFIAGYRWTDNDERVYFPEIFDDEDDAARAADGHAEWFAEQAREDNEKWNAARRLEDDIEDAVRRLRECLVLRHHKCMEYVRNEIASLIETIRNHRNELRTTYKNYI